MSPFIEYRRVHRDDSLSMDYLKLIYNTTYQELFPDADDRESWEQWMLYLNSAADQNFFILAGENMDDPTVANIHGFVIGSYFSTSQTGLICYIGVDRRYRGNAVATGLIDALSTHMDCYAQAHAQRLNGLFAEANDPDQVEAHEDSLPPAIRLKIYHRWGAMQVPITYVYPNVRTPWKKEGCMLLLAMPVRGKFAAPETVLGMIADYYRAAGITPETDADFCVIRDQISVWPGYVSLAPYNTPSKDEMIAA